jgi:hypothetical protein
MSDRRKTNGHGDIRARVHEFLATLVRTQVYSGQFATADGEHLLLQSTANLPSDIGCCQPFLNTGALFSNKTDCHRGTDNRSAHATGIADTAPETGSDSRDEIAFNVVIPTHGQEHGLGSDVPLLHDFGSQVLFHRHSPLDAVSGLHHPGASPGRRSSLFAVSIL